MSTARRRQGTIKFASYQWLDYQSLGFYLGEVEFGPVETKLKIDCLGGVVQCRVARWFVFKPKIPLWVNLGGP
jgi:hypothetical protein